MQRFVGILVVAGYAVAGGPLGAAEPPTELTSWLQPQVWARDVDGPILSLGAEGSFDDRHIFAPAVIADGGKHLLWYSGSQGNPGNRVFRLGLASSADGKRFEKHGGNPVLQFADGAHSVLTPAPLRSPSGQVLREGGKIRLYFSSAMLGKSGLHSLHQSQSTDGVTWDEPSPALMEHVYCPTVIKEDDGTYHMWYSDVSRRPWVIRHAASQNGARWQATERPALVLSQAWEAEVLTYPTVLKADGVYLMWYGSYDRAIRRETTAIGFAVSSDGKHWFKSPHNPVLRPDPARPWESNYVGSGCVLRHSDGSFRYYYASRKAPPFRNLYFAINTVIWAGPGDGGGEQLRLPPAKGNRGLLSADAASGRSVELLEVIDERNAIVRAWYIPDEGATRDATFVDLWLRGVETKAFASGGALRLTNRFSAIGNELIDTTCGKRSFVVLEADN